MVGRGSFSIHVIVTDEPVTKPEPEPDPDPEERLKTPDSIRNFALEGMMSASSEVNPINRVASRANDGIKPPDAANNNNNNNWQPADIGEEWLMLNFGRRMEFDRFEIYQVGTRIRNFEIRYSDDAEKWVTLQSGLSMGAEHRYAHTEKARGRYVQLFIGNSNNATPVANFEFEVYNDEYA